MAFVTYTVRLVRAFNQAYTRKWSFLAAFLLVFFASLSMLSALDLLPNAEQVQKDATKVLLSAAVAPAVVAAPELPIKIEIPAINVTASVENPDTTNITVLDEALLHGAVRYPTSAKLGEPGNVILFGHSSYLPVVNNKAFKTFDGIQNLKGGDRINVSSNGRTYVYAVDTVAKANANDAAIPLTVSGSKLTLATCNSFGTKSDRFIVTASLVESHPQGA